MTKLKKKTITELEGSLLETFNEVASGESQIITHKNGSSIAMVPVDTIEMLTQEVELHKDLAIGYAQALSGEGLSTSQLIEKLKKK